MAARTGKDEGQKSPGTRPSGKDTVLAQIDPELKARAEDILAELGLDAGEAVRLFYRQVVLTRGLPFALRLPADEVAPGALTSRTIRDALDGKDVIRVESVDELFERAGI